MKWYWVVLIVIGVIAIIWVIAKLKKKPTVTISPINTIQKNPPVSTNLQGRINPNQNPIFTGLNFTNGQANCIVQAIISIYSMPESSNGTLLIAKIAEQLRLCSGYTNEQALCIVNFVISKNLDVNILLNCGFTLEQANCILSVVMKVMNFITNSYYKPASDTAWPVAQLAYELFACGKTTTISTSGNSGK